MTRFLLCGALLAPLLAACGGPQQPLYRSVGSAPIGTDASTGQDVHVPVSDVLPMVHPNDLVLGGWDISGASLDKAMERAQVLDYDLQRQVAPHMALLGKPLPSIYYPDFIAANQEARADNLIPGELAVVRDGYIGIHWLPCGNSVGRNVQPAVGELCVAEAIAERIQGLAAKVPIGAVRHFVVFKVR